MHSVPLPLCQGEAPHMRACKARPEHLPAAAPTPNPWSPKRCRDTVQLYKQLADAGLQYGPAFRLLRNVHVPDQA